MRVILAIFDLYILEYVHHEFVSCVVMLKFGNECLCSRYRELEVVTSLEMLYFEKIDMYWRVRRLFSTRQHKTN